ncbi:MAG: ABC transporter substrate-binding protein, partial [Sulfurimonas sp.]
KRFESEYAKALEWYKSHPKEAGELVAKNIDMFKSEAISDSIEHVKLFDAKAIDVKNELEDFFSTILEIEPKLIGGKLPDSGFYYK